MHTSTGTGTGKLYLYYRLLDYLGSNYLLVSKSMLASCSLYGYLASKVLLDE